MSNNYIPKAVKIERVLKEAPDVKTFYLKYPSNFTPGQFIEVSSLGAGEAPISISSAPDEKFLNLTFKRTGKLTSRLFDLRAGDFIYIRGPFGNGFPIGNLEGKDLILIAGGLGMAPIRSLLKFILLNKKSKFGNVILLYGARTPVDLLYKSQLNQWAKSIEALVTVDIPGASWKGHVGLVTHLLNKIHIDSARAIAFICGPGIMMRFTAARLVELGMKSQNINLSLERHMKCGIGRCGHCYIADKFVCRDGPIFSYEQLNRLIPTEII